MELDPGDARARLLAERAAEPLAAAGGRALLRGDRSAATNLLSRAVELLPKGDERRIPLLVDLGHALAELGEFERAEGVLLEAVEAAGKSGQRALELRATLDRLAVREAVDQTAFEEFKRTAKSSIEELEELGDEAALAHSWAMIAHVRLMELNGGAMAEALERSIEYAQRAGDRRREIDSLVWLLNTYWFGPRPIDEGIELAERLLEDTDTEPGLEAAAVRVLGCLYGLRGEFDRSREFLDRAITMQLELGSKVALGSGTMMGGMVELLADDPVAAERRLRFGYDILEPTGEKGYLSTLVANLAEALYRQGRYDEAEEATREANELAAPEDVETHRLWKAVEAKVLAQRGELEAAERLGREAVALSDQTDSFARGDTRLALAEVLNIAGRTDEAAVLAREAVAVYEEKGITPAADQARRLLAEL